MAVKTNSLSDKAEKTGESTTLRYRHEPEYIETVVGDEKQEEFFARVKLKKWNNTCNFSMGVVQTKKGKYSVKNDVISYREPGVEARFYNLKRPSFDPPTKLRQVIKNGRLKPRQASSQYENFNRTEEFTVADYVVTEPTIMMFDASPADLYMNVDDEGYAKDYDYKDKKAYHPKDVPIPYLGKTYVTRIYSPYSLSANPLYIDSGLHLVHIRYGQLPVKGVMEKWIKSVRDVLLAHGVKTYRPTTRSKLYFKHKGRLVKFHSPEEARGSLAIYINLNNAYNKAYDHYRPDVEKDIRDQYAYGLQQAYPEIDDSVVQEMIEYFAGLMDVDLEHKPYSTKEKAAWAVTERIHSDIDWITCGRRKDAGWFHREHRQGYEFEVILDKPPATNRYPFTIRTKNLSFEYQDELTKEDYAGFASRLPDVIGSYAIYHADREKLTGRKYKTGKICHLYRPIVIDAEGWSYFADWALDLDNEIMEVVIPQEFLDKAVYPIIIDPTFGYSSVGASTQSLDNRITGTVFTGAVGYASKAFAYIDSSHSGNASVSYRCALYKNSDSTLVAATMTGESISASWKEMTFSNQPIAATDYMVVAWGYALAAYEATASIVIAYDTVGGSVSKFQSAAYNSSTSWPNPASFSADAADRRYSIYIEYSVASPPRSDRMMSLFT